MLTSVLKSLYRKGIWTVEEGNFKEGERKSYLALILCLGHHVLTIILPAVNTCITLKGRF